MLIMILVLVLLRTVMKINMYAILSINAVYILDAIWHQTARGLPQCNEGHHSSTSEDLLLHRVTPLCVQLLKLSFSDQLLKESCSFQSSAVATMITNMGGSKQ